MDWNWRRDIFVYGSGWSLCLFLACRAILEDFYAWKNAALYKKIWIVASRWMLCRQSMIKLSEHKVEDDLVRRRDILDSRTKPRQVFLWIYDFRQFRRFRSNKRCAYYLVYDEPVLPRTWSLYHVSAFSLQLAYRFLGVHLQHRLHCLNLQDMWSWRFGI